MHTQSWKEAQQPPAPQSAQRHDRVGSTVCMCSPRQCVCASARHRPAAAPIVVSPSSPAISTRSGDSSAPGMREGAGGREAWRTHGTGDSERHAPPHVTDPAGLYVNDLTLTDCDHALCGRQSQCARRMRIRIVRVSCRVCVVLRYVPAASSSLRSLSLSTTASTLAAIQAARLALSSDNDA